MKDTRRLHRERSRSWSKPCLSTYTNRLSQRQERRNRGNKSACPSLPRRSASDNRFVDVVVLTTREIDADDHSSVRRAHFTSAQLRPIFALATPFAGAPG